ncbi:plasmid antitoxin with HTH domain [Gordonia phage Daredevil]|uniref:Antitoxin n=1 Tax=Gordonia phage Daredevil TaxID=2283286 RepID=A0A345MIY2_9CAUD|nr:plasmid antitoxin with HTH domain [Gordonia phage Daredevil]AXH70513.1 antitoxin [Gordonia phage Daredevil]
MATEMPIHPGEQLQDFMEDYDLSQRRLADLLDVSPRTINEIIRGQRGVSAAMSLRLGRLFSQSDSFWSNLQAEYDIRSARRNLELMRSVLKIHSLTEEVPS